MKKTALLLFLLTTFIWVRPVSARTTVNVSTNVNSTNNTTAGTDSHTKIRIESNGEVKEYESSEPGNVHLESSDSNSKVTINNNSGSNVLGSTTSKPSPKPTSSPTADDSTSPSATLKVEISHNTMQKIFAGIHELFAKLFTSLFR